MKSGTHVVLMTEGGLALAVDWARRKVAWAALLASNAGDRSGVFRVRQEGSIAYATFVGGRDLVALDLDRAKVCWRRPIDDGADLAAMDRDRFYVLGDELCAYSRRDRRLLWSRQFWGSVSRIVETRGHLYVMFANGVRELSKDDGDDVRVLRGDQQFFSGSALWAVPAGLVGVGAESVSLLRMGKSASSRATTVPESKESQ